MRFKVVFIAFAFIAFNLSMTAPIHVAPSQDRIFYVAPTGNDLNQGTEASPWRTIRKAADTLIAGDTVYIKAGTYKERVIPKNSGTDASHLITYASYPGQTPTIDGSSISVPEDEGLFHIQQKKYITVSGLKITNSKFFGIYADRSSNIIIQKNRTFKTVSSGIAASGCTNVVVDNNDVAKACSGGIHESVSIIGTKNFEVKDNHVHHVAHSEKEGIDAKDGSNNGKVYGNNVHNITAVGIYVEAWTHHTYNIEVFGNIVHDITDAPGIELATEMGGLLEKIKVYNNIVYRCKYFGIAVADSGVSARHPIRNIEIVNNTIWGNGIPWGGGISIYDKDARNILIRNNICSRNTDFQIAIAATIPAGTVKVDHNLINPFMGYEDEVRGTDFVEADPQFVNPTKKDFHLKAGSPAVDKGSSTKAPALDYDGTSRPQDGDGDGIAQFDIGGYETSAAAQPWKW